MKVTHISTFIDSLKSTWIRRYVDNSNGPWKYFFDFSLNVYGKKYFFNCNCSPCDVKTIDNNFVRQVMEAWCRASYYNPRSDFGNQHIWNNSNIRVNDKIVFYPRLFEKNVQYVRDLFDDHGRPLSFETFINKFNIDSLPFTLYLGLVNSIPHNWRESIHLFNDRNANEELFDKLLSSYSSSQFIYSILIKKIAVKPTACLKWQAIYDNISNEDWSRFFCTPWKSTSDSSLRYFQFRFLHRVLPTNRLLSLMNKTDNPLCTFCESEVETIDHLFWDCSFTSTFILDVENLFLRKQFFFSKRDYYFCCIRPCHPFNFLTMHMKKFIFECKLRNEKPLINDFFRKFKFAVKVEQQKRKKVKTNVNFSDLERAFASCPNLFSSH